MPLDVPVTMPTLLPNFFMMFLRSLLVEDQHCLDLKST